MTSCIVGWISAMLSLMPVHEGSHAALTYSPWMWRILGATHDIANGASFYIWIHQHFLGHHPFTNVEGSDPDVWVNDPDIRRILPSQKKLSFHQYQQIYAPFLYAFLAVKFRINDIVIFFFSKTNGNIRLNPPGIWHSSIFIFGKVFFFDFSICFTITMVTFDLVESTYDCYCG